MKIQEIQEAVDSWIKENTPGYWKPSNMMLRLVEEVGELSREVNHEYGEKPKKEDEGEEDIEGELGDLLFTIVCIANSLNVSMDDAFRNVMRNTR